MADELTLAVGGGGSLLSIIGGWFLRTLNARLKTVEDKADLATKDGFALALALAEYKLKAQENFAKDSDVKAMESELKSGIERLHTRLDSTATKDDLAGLKIDIKEFIVNIKK